MTLKAFFITTAALEVGAGITLLLAPLQAAKLLLGTSPNDPETVVIEKIAGCALIALALANWLARNDNQNAAARGIVWGMVVYDLWRCCCSSSNRSCPLWTGPDSASVAAAAPAVANSRRAAMASGDFAHTHEYLVWLVLSQEACLNFKRRSKSLRPVDLGIAALSLPSWQSYLAESSTR